MIKQYSTNKERRAARTRLKIRSRSELPRLSIFRSNKYIYAQVIDDQKGVTLAAAAGKDAKIVGQEIAKRAGKAKITKVVLDRGGYRYHGQLKILAEAAREGGLTL